MEPKKTTAFSIRDLLGLQHKQYQQGQEQNHDQDNDLQAELGSSDVSQNLTDQAASAKLPVDKNANNLDTLTEDAGEFVDASDNFEKSNTTASSRVQAEPFPKENYAHNQQAEKKLENQGQIHFQQQNQRQGKKYPEGAHNHAVHRRGSPSADLPYSNEIRHDMRDSRLCMQAMSTQDVPGVDGRLDSTALRWRGSQMDTLLSSGQPMINFNLFSSSSQNSRDIFGCNGKCFDLQEMYNIYCELASNCICSEL